MKLVALGDCVCDTYLDEGVFYPGGQAVNVAVNAKQSGAEQSNYVGIFGDDYAAEHVRATLVQEGVGTERCRRVYLPTPRPGVRIVEGDRVFFRGNRDTAAHLLQMRIAQEDLDFLAKFDICHTTNEAGVDAELSRIHAVVPLSYDFSTGRDDVWLKSTCPSVDIAFFSGADLTLEQIDELGEKVQQLGSKIVVVTRGDQGSVCLAGGKRYVQGIVPCDVVDTMGAGDSFAAAFLVKYFQTKDIPAALAFAASRAAITCTRHGAFGYPHPFEG
jgi:fructoselysine 6-kinase